MLKYCTQLSVLVACYVDKLKALCGLFYMLAKSTAMLMQALVCTADDAVLTSMN